MGYIHYSSLFKNKSKSLWEEMEKMFFCGKVYRNVTALVVELQHRNIVALVVMLNPEALMSAWEFTRSKKLWASSQTS